MTLPGIGVTLGLLLAAAAFVAGLLVGARAVDRAEEDGYSRGWIDCSKAVLTDLSRDNFVDNVRRIR